MTPRELAAHCRRRAREDLEHAEELRAYGGRKKRENV
jgi:hypothetical protein